MKRLLVLVLSLSIVLAGCGQQNATTGPINGQFEVVSGESNINFTSIKNQDAGVSGFFDEIHGTVTVPKNGNINEASGKITLSLSSLNTGLKVRDQRVLKHFFETETQSENGTYSEAVFEVSSLDSEQVKKVSAMNKSVKMTALGTLKIHGESVKQSVNLLVTRTAKDEVRITTRKPYVFNVETFNMVEPLEKLMEVCGHKDVSMAVPIDINLTLRSV